MAFIYELDMYGNERAWEAGEGQCPQCGAPCSYDFGLDGAPDRMICSFCGYREGYDL